MILPRIGECIEDSQDNLWKVSDISHTYMFETVTVNGEEVNALKHGIVISTMPIRN